MNRRVDQGSDGRELDLGPRLEAILYRETGCFGGSGSLRLSGRVLEASGALPGWTGPWGPIRLTRMEIDAIYRVLDRRGVWHWKPEYRLPDKGEAVLDGRSWELIVTAAGRSLACRGTGAFPGAANGNGSCSPRPGLLRQLLDGIARVVAAP
jgi:hypothetical protein